MSSSNIQLTSTCHICHKVITDMTNFFARVDRGAKPIHPQCNPNFTDLKNTSSDLELRLHKITESANATTREEVKILLRELNDPKADHIATAESLISIFSRSNTELKIIIHDAIQKYLETGCPEITHHFLIKRLGGLANEIRQAIPEFSD